MKLKRFIFFTLLFSLYVSYGLSAKEEKIKTIVKQLVLNSDHIITGVLTEFTTKEQGHKTIVTGTVKVEDIISSDLKVGDTITVYWETQKLMTIHHELFKNIQVIWLLQKNGDLYYANHPERLQSLEEYENIYGEINSYSTRVYLPERYFWNDQTKQALLIFRNIESGVISLPIAEWQNDTLKLDQDVVFHIFPITLFTKTKTVIGKTPLKLNAENLQKNESLTRKLKTDEEYRLWIDLNQLHSFGKAAYYSVSLAINGFPGQSISAFEVRNRMKIHRKYDFLEIAKDRFASEAQKNTVRLLMEEVNAQTPEEAFKKLSTLKYLCLSDKNITDISPLGSFVQLEQLDLSKNKIHDLTPIRQYRNLVYLDLSQNQISNIEVIGYLSSLNLLDLTQNEIETITPLKYLLNLFFLYLGDNEIEEVTALENLRHLRILDLSKNEIEEIKALSKLFALQEVNLRHNHIQMLDPLILARNLLLLDARDNPVSYIENLEPLIKKHTNDYGQEIELKLLHQVFEKDKENETADTMDLLPQTGQKTNLETPTEHAQTNKEETFGEQVARTTGIVVTTPQTKTGNIVEVLEKENLVLIQFQDALPHLADEMTIYRQTDYIGIVKIVDITKAQAIGKIIPELMNDKNLKIAIGDSVRAAQKE